MTDQSIDIVIHKFANRIVTSFSETTRIETGLRGKLGVVIFLLHYAKQYNRDKYESYATELLEYIQDSLIIGSNKTVVNYDLIDIGIGMNYIVSQELAVGDLDEVLDEVDSYLLSYLDYENVLYLKYQHLTAIGKYFLLRIEATPLSVNHPCHIKALERIVELLKLHTFGTSICNPAIVKFLYLSSRILPDKSIESLLIQQLNHYPNQTDWYRSGIPHWFDTFFIPEDNEALRNIIIKEIEEHSRKCLDNDWSDTLESGTAGLIVWMNLMFGHISENKYSNIKNTAIKKIESKMSNINQYKILTDISLHQGCSGIGLALLSCIDNKCNQWIKLL